MKKIVIILLAVFLLVSCAPEPVNQFTSVESIHLFVAGGTARNHYYKEAPYFVYNPNTYAIDITYYQYQHKVITAITIEPYEYFLVPKVERTL